MSYKIAAIFATALSVVPAVAMAQDASGALTFGYAHGNLGGGVKPSALTFDGIVNVGLGNNLSLNARANTGRIKVNGLPGSVSTHVLGLGLSYALGNGGWVGGFIENGNVGLSTLPVNFGYTQYGIEGGYKLGGVDVAGFIGYSTDVTSVGISGKYSDGARYQVGGALISSRIDLGGAKQNTNFAGLAGAYAVTSDINVFGGVGRTGLSGLGNLTTVGLGLSYGLGETMANSTLSLELARSSVSGGLADMNSVRVGVTIPLGGNRTTVPQNSVAGSILNPGKNTISQTVLGAF